MKRLIFAFFILSALFLTVNAQKKAKTNKIQKVKTNSTQKVKTSSNLCPGNGLTEMEIGGILDAHNKARADVGLAKFKWNCKLADFAQAWAKRGIFEHRSNLIYGENIYVSADTSVVPASGVQSWLLEKSFWNNSNATCENGKVCTHYTQIVWKATTEIGCGINRNATGTWKVMLVCNYSPAGNLSGKAF